MAILVKGELSLQDLNVQIVDLKLSSDDTVYGGSISQKNEELL